MKVVLYRTDGSKNIGQGHIMRGIAIAQALRIRGIKVEFVCRESNLKIRKIVNSSGFSLISLPSRLNYSDDAQATIEIAHTLKSKIIIADLNNAEAMANKKNFLDYIKYIYQARLKTVIIDGNGPECITRNNYLPLSMLIVPYINAEKKSYRVLKNTQLCLGIRYYVFRKEFIRTSLNTRAIRKDVKNIIIILSIAAPGYLDKLIFNVLSQLKHTNLTYKIAKNLKDKKLLKLIKSADIGIITSGLTRYEVMLLGLPSVVIALNTIQQQIIEEEEKLEIFISLGKIHELSSAKMVKVLRELIQNQNLRKKISYNSIKLFDKNGGARIASCIANL